MLDPEILRRLAELNLPSINKKLAMNSSTPRFLLDRWALANEWGRRLLASNRNLSPEVLEELSKDQNVRRLLAANPSTPESTLKTYAASKDESILISLARNLSTPEEAMEKFFAPGIPSDLKWNLLSNPELSLGILKKFVAAGVPPNYRPMLDNQPNMTDELRWLMGIDEREALRLARDPNTPTEVLAKLSAEERFAQSSPRLAFLKHPNIPKTFLEEAVQRVNIPSEEKMCIAQNPSATPEMLNALAVLPGKNVGIEIASHPNTSFETLGVLAQSKEKEVREAAQKRLNKKT